MPSFRTMSQLSDDEIHEAERLYTSTSRTAKDIAENLGVKVSSLKNFMSDHGIPKHNQDSDPDLSAKVSQDIALERVKADLKNYKTLYQSVIRKEALHQRVIDEVRDAVSPIEPLPLQPISVAHVKTKHTQLPVALMSDWHFGEVVSSEEMGGISHYDMGIANRRLAFWTQQVIELVSLRRSFASLPDLVIAALGDILGGVIHDELARTNEGHETSILSRSAYMIAQSLGQLSSHFENIHFHGVVGNHGRMHKKPEAKERWNNWDYILYQLLALFCQNMENVHFNLPKSFYTIIEANGTRLLAMHGDGIKSFQSIPWYGINRTAANLRNIFQNTDKQFDGVVLGHFHSPADIDGYSGPIIINGSAKGSDEFALGRVFAANHASQTLAYFHPKHGRIATEILYLEDADDLSISLHDPVSDVWADAVINK